ncbi:MAG: hypothetical protein WD824_13605 [Cyclobacteriaceae bacterium]
MKGFSFFETLIAPSLKLKAEESSLILKPVILGARAFGFGAQDKREGPQFARAMTS